MTQITQILTEIAKLKEEARRNVNMFPNESIVWVQQMTVCDRLLKFYDNLPKEMPKDELEQIKEAWYREGFIDGKFNQRYQFGPECADLVDASNNYCLNIRKGYPRVKDEIDIFICNAFKAGSQWQLEQLLEIAYDETIYADRWRDQNCVSHYFGWDDTSFKPLEKVKMIIIRQDEKKI